MKRIASLLVLSWILLTVIESIDVTVAVAQDGRSRYGDSRDGDRRDGDRRDGDRSDSYRRDGDRRDGDRRDGDRSDGYRRDGDRRDGDRSDGDRREGDGRRSFDPTEMLKRMDSNNNGLIEPSEMSSRARSFIERAATSAGLDVNQPMPLDRLATGFRQMGDSSRGGSPGGSSSSSSSTSSTKPAPPTGPQSFGAPSALAPAAGFDVPLTVDASKPADKRYDPRVVEYVANMLREQDKNNDGFIDSIEWKAGRWSSSAPPETSDTNRDNRLSREELYSRITKRFNLPLPGQKPTMTSYSSSQGSSSSSGSSSGDLERYKRYAESLIKQHDKDKDGRLERRDDEWNDLKSEQRDADKNRDSVITLDEMAVHLQTYSKGGRSSRDNNVVAKKSYRFLSPAERLPKGIPESFLYKDTNGDGQVSMTEHTTSWTEAAAAEFLRYDLDGDGFITPNECLTVEGKK